MKNLFTPDDVGHRGTSSQEEAEAIAKRHLNPRPYCIDCGVDLEIFDRDPNGDENCQCKQCVAEQDHDFDAEPDAKFTRMGERVEEEVKVDALRKMFDDVRAGKVTYAMFKSLVHMEKK